ncbi:unnamed protein product [Linum trigynum]|uniref:Secreted protein n=1 Tax=Linum trigynum TaxID=586398 RepID=A0AAV2GCX4_9ROSI
MGNPPPLSSRFLLASSVFSAAEFRSTHESEGQDTHITLIAVGRYVYQERVATTSNLEESTTILPAKE